MLNVFDLVLNDTFTDHQITVTIMIRITMMIRWWKNSNANDSESTSDQESIDKDVIVAIMLEIKNEHVIMRISEWWSR